jgi:hypothetical protein
MNQRQAAAAAVAFCRAVGIRVGQPIRAGYSGTHVLGINSPLYAKPVWVVQIGQASMQVCDTDGAITEFSDNPDLLTQPSSSSSVPTVPKEKALAKCKSILKAMHLADPVTEPKAIEDRNLHIWYCGAHRVSHGTVFLDQHVSMGLDERSCALEMMSVYFPTVTPSPAKPRIGTDAAMRKAGAYLATKPRGQAKHWTSEHAHLYWLSVPIQSESSSRSEPNRPSAGIRPGPVLRPELIWYCFFRSGDDIIQIPVNAVTGTVITSGLGYLDYAAPPKPTQHPAGTRQPRSG